MNAPHQFVPLPSRPPPASTTGVLGWVRERLFSTPFNSVLTIICVVLLYYILTPTFKWMFWDATFGGSSSDDCKVDITGADGEQYRVDAPGACWSFIRIRFWQIMFGAFYGAADNAGELWRPILMFAMLGGILTLLVVEKFRYKLQVGLFALFVFPFIAFALIHGEWLGLAVAPSDKWGGFMLTFILASVGIVVALPIGIVMALARRSEMPIIRNIAVFYIELWRAAPLITVLFMASNLIPLFAPSGVSFDKVLRAMIAITLFQSAYTAEAIRGGLQAIGKGQFEAGDSLGMGYWMQTGFIILPQALKISIPGIVNTFIALFKDTTLVGIIGLHDFLGMAQVSSRSPEWKGYDFEGYVYVALLFFMCCFAMSRYSQYLENKLHTGHKR